MHEYARSFVSPLVAHQLFQHGHSIPAPAEAELNASVLFTDISGFTGLADHIISGGPDGVEQLTNLINAYFSDVIEQIQAYGGLVVNFAGDAVLAMWPSLDDSIASHIWKGALCAVAIQESSRRFSDRTDLALTTRTALTSGPVVTYAVGSGDGAWASAVLGSPLARIGESLQRAEVNQIVLPPETVASAKGAFSATEIDDGFVILDQIDVPSDSAPTRSPIGQNGWEHDLLKFVPKAVRSRLDVGAETMIAELRQPTIVFVNFPKIDRPIPLAELQEIMDSTVQVLEKYEGAFDKWISDDKGTSIMLAFGLPPAAHEDDPRRALLAAAELQSTLAASNVISSIGVATGRTYCGPVGNDSRREYTVIGSAVNHAARLMQLAEPGTVICDESTKNAVPDTLEFRSVAVKEIVVGETTVKPFVFTGQSQPRVPCPTETVATNLVGRRHEMTTLTNALDEVQSGRGGRAIVLVGEPGIGKSALVTAFMDSAVKNGIAVHTVQADPIEQSTPFHAWAELFGELLESEEVGIGESVSIKLEELGIDVELAPLLTSIISIEIDDTSVTQQLDGQARADATNEIALKLLEGTENDIRALVVEDAHWLDSASWTLLERIVEKSARTFVVISMRPTSDHVVPELDSILAFEPTSVLQLQPLSSDEAIKAVADKLGVSRLPQVVERLVAERADGHPLFSEQIIFGLRDQGILKISEGTVKLTTTADDDLRSTELADSVRGVITTRIDRLPPHELLVLKVACVYGLEFEQESLSDVYATETSGSDPREGIDALLRKSLLATGDDTGTYRFGHPLVQEVAYDQMTFADRRQIHSAVAQWYEAERQGELEHLSPILAHHWHRANDPDRATSYYEKTGSRSMREGSYGEAVGVFKNLLDLASETTEPASNVKLAEWEHNLGQAQLSRGYLDESLQRLITGFRHTRRSWPGGKARLKGGTLLEVFRQTGHLIAPRFLTGRSNREEYLRSAALCESIGQVMYHQNRVNEFLYSILRFLNLSEKAPPSALSARAYGNAASVAGFMGFHRLARRYIRKSLEAVSTSERADDHGLVNEYVGMYYASIGNWSDARAHVQKAVEQFRISGNRRRQLEAKSLTSMMQVANGDLRDAAKTRSELLDDADRQNDLQIYAWALLEQAETAMQLGDLVFASERISSAESPELNLPESEQIWMLGDKAAILTRLGDLDGALEAATDAQNLIDRGGTPAFYLSEAYSGVCEAMLAALDQSDGSERRKRAARSVKSYKKFAKHFPVASANAFMWRGVLEAKRGKTIKGLRLLRSGLEASKVTGVPYLTGLIKVRIAELLDENDIERRTLSAEATETFNAIGAAREAACAKQLAR